MHGIEMGNLLGNMAAGQQKNRPAEIRNVRAARTIEEASAKYEKTAVTETAKESGVFWIRGESGGKVKEGGNNPPWNYAGNHFGTGHFKYRNSNSVSQGASEATNQNIEQSSIDLATKKEQNIIDQNGKKDQNAIGQTGKKDPSAVSQTGKKDPNAVGQDGKNKDGTTKIGKDNQIANTSTSLYGTKTSLSMVDRQRLAQQKKAKAKAKKKNLNYNRREVSSQVLRANKLGTVARALATARTKVATLRRSVGTGQYDENELRSAIAHAESIVKTAKKKLGNLKEEQLKEKRVSREKQANTLKSQVKKQRVRAKHQRIKRELSTKRQQTERQMRAKELRVKQLRRRHRGEELADVAEADLKYIKDMDRYRRYKGAESSGTNTTDTTGTTALEIGDSAMQLSDLERAEQALKYEEQQMGQGAADFYDSSASGIDYAVSDGGSSSDISSGTSAFGGEISVDMAAAEVGGAVDISL